jgi:flagellar hook-associated protein 2
MVGAIDTESIITQLMAVERRPQDLLNTRISTLQKAQTAWQSIADKLTALKTASDAMAGLDSLTSLRTVASSDTSSIGVRATGAAPATSASIDVISLASAQSVLVSDTFTSATDAAAGRTIDLTIGTGALQTFSSADGTIGGLATAINAAGIGVSARVLQTSPGSFQLALTATSSGTANSFTAAGTGWGTFATVRAAADAKLNVDGVSVTRSSNVINDLIDGVELTLQKPTTAAVAISSARDDTSIIAKVKAMVDAANSLGSTVASLTKTSTDAAARGPLAGDFNARKLADSVRSAIAAPLVTASGKTMTSSALGVSLNRDGTINFDPSALSATLASDPASAFAALGRNAASTATGVTVVGATSTSTASSRTIVVTQAASQAGMVGLPTPLPAPGTSVAMQIVTPQGSFNVSFTTAATWAQTAGNLNAALRAAGVKITVVPQTVGGVDQGLNLTDDKFGSSQSFTITGAAALGIDGTSTPGLDATGTIDGTAFVATGRSYTIGGMVLSITATPAQLSALGGTSSGTITLTQGLAGALSGIGAQGGSSGAPLASKDTLATQIGDLQKRVSRYDDVLKQRESVLRAKYSAMQVTLDRLNSISASLGSLGTVSSTG